jgi:hypothetical protein
MAFRIAGFRGTCLARGEVWPLNWGQLRRSPYGVSSSVCRREPDYLLVCITCSDDGTASSPEGSHPSQEEIIMQADRLTTDPSKHAGMATRFLLPAAEVGKRKPLAAYQPDAFQQQRHQFALALYPHLLKQMFKVSTGRGPLDTQTIAAFR